MSENQNNETLCDFIRETRSQADELAKHLGDQHTLVEQKKQLADRLDQIRMRMEIEQAKLRGNSAALREALEKIDAMETPHNFQMERSDIADACYDLTRAIKLAHAALAIPRRNCDVGTAAEQSRRFCAFCRPRTEPCDGCACLEASRNGRCEFVWAQMQYVEGEVTK